MNEIYSILQSIGFDWQVALANLINFLIIVWLLKKFAWKPIQAKLSERQSLITQGLEDAQNAERQLRDAEKSATTLVKDAKTESEGIIASAHDERKNIINIAEKDAIDKKSQLHTEAKNQIEKYKEEEMKTFKGEAAVLFEEIAKKVFSEELTDEARTAYALKAAAKINI